MIPIDERTFRPRGLGRLRNGFVVHFLLFLLALLAFREVLAAPGIVGHTWDWGFPLFPEQFRDRAASYLFAWKDVLSLGVPSHIEKTEALYWLLLLPFSSLGGVLLAKGFLVAVTALAGSTSYLLGRSLGFGKYAAFLMALYYMFSPVLYTRVVAGHLPVVLAYALLPLFVMAALKGVRGQPRKTPAMVTAGILFAMVSLHPMILVAAAVMVGVMALAEMLATRGRVAPVGRAVAILSLGLLINSFWVFPFLQASFGSSELQRGWGLAADLGEISVATELPLREQFLRSTSAPLIDALRGVARTGMDTEFVYPPPQAIAALWEVASFAVPFFAFLPLLWRPRETTYYAFLGIALLGIIFTAGLTTVFGSLFYQGVLYRRPELFAQFANPNRFLPLTATGYAVLLGYCAHEAPRHWRAWVAKAYRLPRLLPWAKAAGVVPLAALGVYAAPFVSGRITESLVPGTQPHSLLVTPVNPEDRHVYEFLRHQEGDFRVTYLPPASLSYVGETDLSYEWSFAFSPKPEFMSGYNAAEPLTKFLVATLYQPDIQATRVGRLLGLANVRYVVYPRYERFVAYKSFPVADVQRALEASLAAQEDLVAVAGPNPWTSVALYRNQGFLPHIYAAARPTLLYGDFGLVEALSRGPDDLFTDPALFLADQLSPSGVEMVKKMGSLRIVAVDDPVEVTLSAYLRPFITGPGEAALTRQEPREGWANLAFGWNYDWHYAAAVNPSQGVHTFAEASLELPVAIHEDGRYAVYLRPHLGPEASRVSVLLDGNPVGAVVTKHAGHEGFRWVRLGELSLASGRHLLELQSEQGDNAVLAVALVPPARMQGAIRLWNDERADKLVLARTAGGAIPAPEEGARGSAAPIPRPYEVLSDAGAVLPAPRPELQATKVNATRYEVAVRGVAAPFVLVFSETFNPGWRALLVEDKERSGPRFGFPALLSRLLGRQGTALPGPLRVNGYANAWYVDRRGDFTLLLLYEPQVALEAGLVATGLTLFLSAGYLLMRRLSSARTTSTSP